MLPMLQDRGAEQGDVGGPLECSWALGTVAAETRRRVAAQQVAGSLPWVVDPSDVRRQQAEHAVRTQRHYNLQLGGAEKLSGADDPRHALQENGGLADLWYMDDGDIVCHPILVPTPPMPELVRNETHRRRKSFTTWTTWMQHLPNEKLTT